MCVVSVRNELEILVLNLVVIDVRDLGLIVIGDKGEDVVVLKGCLM